MSAILSIDCHDLFAEILPGTCAEPGEIIKRLAIGKPSVTAQDVSENPPSAAQAAGIMLTGLIWAAAKAARSLNSLGTGLPTDRGRPVRSYAASHAGRAEIGRSA